MDFEENVPWIIKINRQYFVNERIESYFAITFKALTPVPRDKKTL